MNFLMKEIMGRYDIVIFSLTSASKRFIEPVIVGAPSVQIPTHWFHDTTGVQIRRQYVDSALTFSCFWQFCTTAANFP
jgi:hypothetical protein